MTITTKKTTSFHLNAKETNTLRIVLKSYSKEFIQDSPVCATFASRMAEEIDKSVEAIE